MRPELVRAVVVEVYEQVRREGALADRALERVLRRERKSLHSVERRQSADVVYGLLRLQGRIDWLLSRAVEQAEKRTLDRLATPTQHLLRFAAYLVLGEGRTPAEALTFGGAEVRPHAQALELLAHPEGLPWPEDPLDRLAAQTSLPRWLAALWMNELGEDGARKLAEALNERAPLTIRANLLKGTRDELVAKLAAEGIAATPTKLSPWGASIESRTNARALTAFKQGLFEVQDEGSQLIALACAARPGQTVVDACAGAGGKALALAAEMHNKGKLLACDRDGRRLEELKLRARRAGAHNFKLLAAPEGKEGDARLLPELGKHDVVLVDAPCSGLGALRRNPDARWRLTAAEVATFPPRQAEILERYSALVKPGGRLVYATCSVNRAENEAIADGFAAAHPEFSFEAPESYLGAELARALGAGPRGVQLLPHVHGTDGFYFASFVRAGDLSPTGRQA